MIASTVRNTASDAAACDAPCRINQPRIGSTVMMVNTSARKTGPMIPGIARIPAATTTQAASPRMMIKARGRLHRTAQRRCDRINLC